MVPTQTVLLDLFLTLSNPKPLNIPGFRPHNQFSLGSLQCPMDPRSVPFCPHPRSL